MSGRVINEVIAAIGKGLNAEFGDIHLWQQLIAVIHSAGAMSNITERKQEVSENGLWFYNN